MFLRCNYYYHMYRYIVIVYDKFQFLNFILKGCMLLRRVRIILRQHNVELL